MATINYENKEAINVNPTIPNKNKVVDSDMNLIKNVGNQILTTLGVYTDNWDDEETYLVDDIVVYDNRYFKNLTGTNTATPPTEDTTNWLEVTIRDISGGAEIPIQDTAPSNPQDDDLWIDTSDESGGINILSAIFPVGSIVIKADNEDYSNWLGFTWERTLVGRVAVGIDSDDTDFDTISETGGSKTDDLSNAYALVGRNTTNLNTISYKAKGGVSATFDRTLQSGGGIDGNNYACQDATTLGGSINKLQPYQVVAYWKRTA